MNRRNFISALTAGLAGIGTFNILPGAGRLWRARRRCPWDDRIIPIIYRREISPFVPAIQDFLILNENVLMPPSIQEGLEILKMMETPKIWPPNMEETRRIVNEFKPIYKP